MVWNWARFYTENKECHCIENELSPVWVWCKCKSTRELSFLQIPNGVIELVPLLITWLDRVLMSTKVKCISIWNLLMLFFPLFEHNCRKFTYWCFFMHDKIIYDTRSFLNFIFNVLKVMHCLKNYLNFVIQSNGLNFEKNLKLALRILYIVNPNKQGFINMWDVLLKVLWEIMMKDFDKDFIVSDRSYCILKSIEISC